jgi:hypothetical protein
LVFLLQTFLQILQSRDSVCVLQVSIQFRPELLAGG